MKFISKYKKLTYWIEPSYYTNDALGRRSFVAGKFAQFDNGIFSTNDQVIIKAMLESPDCGRDFAPVQITEELIPTPELAKVDNYSWAKKEPKDKKEVELKEEKPASGEFICEKCGKVCRSKLGLLSHQRRHR